MQVMSRRNFREEGVVCHTFCQPARSSCSRSPSRVRCVHARYPGRGQVPQPADTHRPGILRRRRQRHAGAHRRRQARRASRPAGRRRDALRRRRHRRHDDGGRGDARRLHAAPRPDVDHDSPQSHGQAALRSDEGVRAGQHVRHRAVDPARAPVGAGQVRQGADRLREGAAGDGELRDLRHRHDQRPGRSPVQLHGGRQDRERAVQGLGAVVDRRARQRDSAVLRAAAARDSPRPEPAARAARHEQPEAQPRAARRAGDRGRDSRLRDRRFFRHRRLPQGAEADHRAAAPRVQRRAGSCRRSRRTSRGRVWKSRS